MDGSQISCATVRALALNSREQLIREQREYPELGHIFRYLENPDDSSFNANGLQYIAGPSHQIDTWQGKPPTEWRRQERSGQYDKARETRTTTSGTNRAAKRRPVRSKQAISLRHFTYYLRS
ncbi:hypothetical protein TNCV_3893361 [Trichonephila clavipes]|nr:hypothetical protein TNCV_3893361 [Trichonephila clavipes]